MSRLRKIFKNALKSLRPTSVYVRFVRNHSYKLRKTARQQLKATRRADRQTRHELQLSILRTGRIGNIDKTTIYESKDVQ